MGAVFAYWGGGGAKGRVHVPTMKAVRACYGEEIAGVGGTSIGAWSSALFAQGSEQIAYDLWDALEQKDDDSAWNGLYKMTRLALGPNSHGIFTQDPLVRAVEKVISLSRVRIPCTVGVADPQGMEHLDLCSSDCPDDTQWLRWVRSSAYIDGIFTPVEPLTVPGRAEPVSGIDGGHLRILPRLPATLRKGDRVHIFLCDTLPTVGTRESPRNWLEHLLRGLGVIWASRLVYELEEWRALARSTGAEILVHALPEHPGSLLAADATTLRRRDQLGLASWENPVRL